VDSDVELIRGIVAQLPNQASATKKLAAVQPDPELDRGWYIVLRRLSASQIESIAEGRLRPGNSRDAPTFDVLEVAADPDRVRVRASITAPEGPLELLVPTVDQRRTLSGLADGLHKVRDRRILESFGGRMLSPVQDVAAPERKARSTRKSPTSHNLIELRDGHYLHRKGGGAGRKMSRADAPRRGLAKHTVAELRRTPLCSIVICGDRQLLFEEAPSAYKRIEQVVADLVDHGLATAAVDPRQSHPHRTP
jgi:tRNA-splicing ligase RtcB